MSDTVRTRTITGILGLIGAITVGAGEFLLHFDSLARYSASEYLFMADISDGRLNVGHFLAVFGIPLYFFGCWHIYQMLRPAGERVAYTIFLVASFGFFLGGVWISSRASIASLMHYPELLEQTNLVALYVSRYEVLLQGIRLTTLALSITLIVKILTGRTRYPKWMALFNPIVLILGSFAVYLTVPAIGKFVMPIALNVAFAIFFSISLWQTRTGRA